MKERKKGRKKERKKQRKKERKKEKKERKKARKKERKIDIQIDRQIDKQIQIRQMDGQIDRQKDRQIDRYRYGNRYQILDMFSSHFAWKISLRLLLTTWLQICCQKLDSYYALLPVESRQILVSAHQIYFLLLYPKTSKFPILVCFTSKVTSFKSKLSLFYPSDILSDHQLFSNLLFEITSANLKISQASRISNDFPCLDDFQ